VRKLTRVIVPLTGVQYEIEAGQYRATVTELGAGLRELVFRGQPLIAGYEADQLPPAGAGQLLAPWPNRVDGGRYVFGGTEYQLALTEPARGNAIHGLTRPADSWLPLDDRGIPSGPPEPVDGTAFDFRQARVIGTTRLDHALTGLSRGGDGRAWAYLAAPGGPRAGLWAGKGYRWLQVFTGDP